ncbi:hypothetical protein NP233_g4293 [Leucocoprinus birnbaumii]|uniref:F-box domain-containing protein n=1 Tax=Leucocoprinus birnbaumii TaxID=56174 RepID=A0AAD5YXP9_9AGAR|nr:hypothetical protein NP233_g4293 [Leucocoprinus birnbaumii]
MAAERSASFGHDLRLPNEVLSDVFDLSTEPSYDERPIVKTRNLIRLSGVCSHWREVTTSSAVLWRFLDINAGDSVDHLNLLSLHFRNVGDGLLSVRINFATGPKCVNSPAGIVKQLFNPANSSKLRSVALLHINPRLWSTIDNWARDSSLLPLERLDLSWDFVPKLNNGLLFENSPRLRHITLRNCLPDVEGMFPLDKITSLCAYNLSAINAISILGKYPQLKEFYFESSPVSSHSSDYRELLKNASTLSNLRVLSWTSDANGNEALLRNYRLPSLQSLKWKGRFTYSTPPIQRQHFFSSMTDLQRLDCSYDASTVFLWSQLPDLTELIIQHIPNEDLANDCLKRLTIKEGQTSLLPRLKSLKLTMSQATVQTTNSVNAIMRVIMSRRVSPHIEGGLLSFGNWDPDSPHWQSHSRLEYFWLSQPTIPFFWEPSIAFFLHTLIRDGLRVEITENWNERPVSIPFRSAYDALL